MILGKRITLVIPCRNEEHALALLLKKVPKSVDEVLVIDNNSADKTRLVAKKFGARVISEKRQDHGVGYGFAHQTGLKHASGEIVITVDGDNTYPVKVITQLVRYMQKNRLDFVSCNRFPLDDIDVISPVRQLGVWVLNMEVRMLYGFTMQDILSGMWAVRREANPPLTLQEGGWNLSPEIKLEALTKYGDKFGEFHIHHEYRAEGVSKQQIWVTGFDHLSYIFLRWLQKDNSLVRYARKQLLSPLSLAE